MFHRDEKGQVVVEYALVFPIQLLLTLAIIQLAHIFVANQVANYAAFCGARAALVEEDAHEAAAIALSRIAGSTGASEANIVIPGWGEMPRSGGAREKTQVQVSTEDAGGVTVIKCDLEHHYELSVPLANYLVYGVGEMLMALRSFDDSWGSPHIRIQASSTLARPW